jgi:hypothetical protein
MSVAEIIPENLRRPRPRLLAWLIRVLVAGRLRARRVVRPKLLAALVAILGACLLVAGLALIYPPVAFIAAGGGLLAAGLIPDYEPKKPGRR